MGHYNPHVPSILGQEWVPIRDEDINLPDDFSSLGVGQRFSLSSATSLNEVHWYMKDFASDDAIARVGIDVYPNVTDDLTGPIKRIVIPASNGALTGSENQFIGVGTMQAALLSPMDSNYVSANVSSSYVSTDPSFNVFFAGSPYAIALQGKRILAINLLYAMNFPFSKEFLVNNGGGTGTIVVSVTSNINVNPIAFSNWGEQSSLPFDYAVDTGPTPPNNIYRITLGAVNPFWNGGTAQLQHMYNWVPADLSRFEISHANRLGIRVDYGAPSAPSTTFAGGSLWEYMALEVFYCEENRVATGSYLPDLSNVGNYSYTRTANAVVMRHPATLAATPSVGPGSLAVVMYPVLTEGFNNPAGNVNLTTQALRQLYPLPTITGLRLNMPFPFDESIEGQTFTAEETNIVPQLTLHTTTAVNVETHPYGRQVKAEIYGSVTAVQDIYDQIINGARDYPQVRYYARRFGDTNVPLKLFRTSTPTQTVSIGPAEFDELPEIIDGWKEVTLRFDTAVVPSMGAGTNPSWTWSATGEMVGNRWEVLGASAPALSGTPGNLLQLAQGQYVLSSATYGASGAPGSGGQNVNLNWVPGISPMVTATTNDSTSDACLIFSMDPQVPVGLDVSPMSMALAVTDPDCPIDPACIPSDLFYNLISWTPISGASIDTFSRVEASGWGSTEIGQPWQASITPPSAMYVDGNSGIVEFTSGGSIFTSIVLDDVGSPDVEAQVTFSVDTNHGLDQQFEIFLRRTDGNNYYRIVAELDTNATLDLRFSKVVGGVSTHPLTVDNIPGVVWAPGQPMILKARVAGYHIAGKVWAAHLPEPEVWQIFTTDTSLSTGNGVGVVPDSSAVASGTVTWTIDDWSVKPAYFGALELQRYDEVDGEFNTIMLSSGAATTGFSDYEARVGLDSVYRIRQRNVYDFAGLWSDQVTGGVASPGVSGASTALTLFTSNYRQDGSANLAYSAEWETGIPVEDFGWPEASSVTLQAMYRKNFPTAFRPLERGGEVFQRTLLVGAAGVPSAATANGFKDLRDMAWDTVPYVCVRDELGNRWYATVLVPDGKRRRMRGRGHLLTATAQVVEVTDIPYPVDPA